MKPGRWAAALAFGLCGCPTDPMPMTMRDAPAGPTPATLQNRVIYEGMEQFVTVLESPGDDWTSARISSVSSDIEVVASACSASLCGVVLRSRDVSANTGQRIPAVIDGPSRFIDVSGSRESRGLLRLLTLDALTAPVSSTITSSTYFASSLVGDSASSLQFTGNAPVRWFIFGSVEMGELNVSANGAMSGPGGGEGALATMAASGPGAGAAATGVLGAGGGASASAGSPGAMSTSAAMPVDTACTSDPFVDDCGGGGGGGATGAGGGGAGGLSLFALGSLQLARVVAHGGDGESGGGGGGGGLVHLAGRTVSAPTSDVSGGAGDGTGGSGGAGLLRVDGTNGPAFVFETSELLQRAATMDVRCAAAPNAMLVIERVAEGGEVTQLGSGTTDATGSASVSIALVPGLNRLRLVQRAGSVELRAMNGNHFDFARQGSELLPIGGFLDVAYIP